MFRPFLTYKHQNCLDMFLFVQKVTYKGSKYIKAKVIYLARGMELGRETVKIKREDFKYWREV